MTGYEKSLIIENVLNDKKAIDVKIVDLAGLSIIADCFVIATGMNKKHIETLADYCEEAIEEKGERKLRREQSNDWVLIDFGDLVVHIFDQEARNRYSLEDLWSGKLK